MAETKAKKEKKKGGTKAVDLFLVFLMIGFASVAACGGIKLMEEKEEYRTGTDTYTALVETARKDQPDENGRQQEDQRLGPEDVNFDSLKKINNQIVGWINGCGNAIDYPVVHGTDNDYYLKHMVDGATNRSGSIFIDSRNSPGFEDKNTFIYGHNMLNGTMFSTVAKYVDQSHYDQYPDITFVTPDGVYILQAFSGYVTPGTSDTYQLEYADEAAFGEYLDKISRKSNFSSDIKITSRDKIVTLSTCTYDYDDARYVLHCKLTRLPQAQEAIE